MILKNHMLIIFKTGECRRSMTNSPPLQRALELHSEDKTITEIEVYKYISVLKDYKYLCTIKFNKGLFNE